MAHQPRLRAASNLRRPALVVPPATRKDWVETHVAIKGRWEKGTKKDWPDKPIVSAESLKSRVGRVIQ